MPGLEDLLVDRVQLNEELLRSLLLPYVGIDGERQEIVPKATWVSLSAEQKILILLLARKAMSVLPSIALQNEGASPKEIEGATGVPGGTLRPKLRNLKGLKVLAQDKDGGYFVPTHALSQMPDWLKEKEADEQPRRVITATKRSSRNRKSARRKVSGNSIQNPS
jgi:hypothetical protein